MATIIAAHRRLPVPIGSEWPEAVDHPKWANFVSLGWVVGLTLEDDEELGVPRGYLQRNRRIRRNLVVSGYLDAGDAGLPPDPLAPASSQDEPEPSEPLEAAEAPGAPEPAEEPSEGLLDPSEATVAEVLAWLGEHYDAGTVEALIEAERAGRARSTLLQALEETLASLDEG